MENKSVETTENAIGETEKSGTLNAEKHECAVCLQVCVQPVQLPCRHVFCYLCVKGVTHRSTKCAMCRQEIPSNFLDNPVLIQSQPSTTSTENEYQWYYEGRNGWWQYDERTSSEIEIAHQKGEKQCEVLIAGFLYVINFDERQQYRRCDPFRRRRVKRDLSSIPKKGVAGIRVVAEQREERETEIIDFSRNDENEEESEAHSSDSSGSDESSDASTQDVSNQEAGMLPSSDCTLVSEATGNFKPTSESVESDSSQEIRHMKRHRTNSREK